jgi:hypothetical protein
VRGAESLIALRRRGVRPPLVNVHCDAPQDRVMRFVRDAGCAGEVLEIAPDEALHRIDLRCMVALSLIVGGSDAHRVAAVGRACTAAGAKQVIAVHHRITGKGEFARVDVERMATTPEELSTWLA